MRKWHVCLDQVQESSERFSSLCSSLPEEMIENWTNDEALMQVLRVNTVNVMDEYDVREGHGSIYFRYSSFWQCLTICVSTHQS